VVVATVYMAGRANPDQCPDEPYLELSRLYVKALEPGFKPGHRWNTPGEFANLLSTRFGVKVGMNTPPANVQILGWSDATRGPDAEHTVDGTGIKDPKKNGKIHAEGLSADTVTLFARAGDNPVILVIDRLSTDADLSLAQGSRLQKHRREVAGLVIYEIGMADKAVLVDRFEPR
jgi:hypothetical protein